MIKILNNFHQYPKIIYSKITSNFKKNKSYSSKIKSTNYSYALINNFKTSSTNNSIKQNRNRPRDSRPDVAKRVLILAGILMLSRLGVYIPVSSGIDIKAYSETLESSDDVVRYLDALSGNSLGRMGLFSLGIVPYINASIIIQIMTTIIPELKKLQKDGDPSARQKFSGYLKIITLVFSVIQGFGQLNYISPFVPNYSTAWTFENVISLSSGAMILTFLSCEIDKLNIGNGTSLLVFANILSSLPGSFVSIFSGTTSENIKNIILLLILTLVTIIGIVFVQEAERKIPVNYASRYSGSTKILTQTSYLPFKVNATGVMPIIFASTFLALPSNISRVSDMEFLKKFSSSLDPFSPLYILYNVGMIFLFNYFYTFIQFEPTDLSENLKKTGASIPEVRPGKATVKYFERTLFRLSLMGSAFLSMLSIIPLIASSYGDKSFRGFGATSVIILVGVSTDFTRRLRAESFLEELQLFDETSYL